MQIINIVCTSDKKKNQKNNTSSLRVCLKHNNNIFVSNSSD